MSATFKTDAQAQQLAELQTALEELVAGLDATYWSSWQSTHKFWGPLEAARTILAKREDA